MKDRPARMADLDFWVIRGDSVSHESERRRQLLVHVNDSIVHFLLDTQSRVEAGRARSDNGYSERPAPTTSDSGGIAAS